MNHNKFLGFTSKCLHHRIKTYRTQYVTMEWCILLLSLHHPLSRRSKCQISKSFIYTDYRTFRNPATLLGLLEHLKFLLFHRRIRWSTNNNKNKTPKIVKFMVKTRLVVFWTQWFIVFRFEKTTLVTRLTCNSRETESPDHPSETRRNDWLILLFFSFWIPKRTHTCDCIDNMMASLYSMRFFDQLIDVRINIRVNIITSVQIDK